MFERFANSQHCVFDLLHRAKPTLRLLADIFSAAAVF
jgi:hypothetical protein